MDTTRTKKNTYPRTYYSSPDMKKTMPPTLQGRNHVIKYGTEGIGRMGSAWTANYHSILQNKEKQDEFHPVLRINERQW